MRVGVAYFFLTAATLRSRWRLCRLTDAAYPLQVLRAFGAGAVRGCWGGWYTPPLLLQDILTCNLAKSTPSSRRHPQSPPTAAARWCALARLHLSSALRQQQRKQKHRKTSLPQCIFAHLSNQCTTKNALRTARIPSTAQVRARPAAQRSAISARICTHETLPPAPARSAVKRTPSVTTGHQAAQRSTKLQRKIETRFQQVCYPRPLFFFSTVHGALLFLQQGEKEEGGASRFLKGKPPRPRRGRIPRFLKRKNPHRPRRGRNPIPI